jgi:hypothetical protein
MQYFRKVRRYATAILLIGINCALSACSSLTSPVDQAYYKGGDVFAIPGGYTRTIFSTSNF